MWGFELEKYPVISENGNVYRVVVSESIRLNEVQVTLYIKKPYLWIFKTFDRVHTDFFDEMQLAYDYELMVKTSINNYEKIIFNQSIACSNRSEGSKRFKRWDGGFRV